MSTGFSPSPDREPPPPRSARRWAVAVAAVSLLLVAAGCLVRPSRVSATSMQPTLLDGDYVLVTRWPWATPTRGEVVAATLPQIPDTRLVKRLVALGGDTLTVAAGRLRVNGRDAGVAPGLDASTWVLAPGTMYLLGDNRAHSIDSRRIGPFPRRTLWGHPVVVYWSSADTQGHWWRQVRWDRLGARVQ